MSDGVFLEKKKIIHTVDIILCYNDNEILFIPKRFGINNSDGGIEVLKKLTRRNTFRAFSLLLALLMLTAGFTGCAARALPTSDEDLTVVGTVGEFEVYYEELRFLVLSYREHLENKYGEGIWNKPENAEKYLPELRDLVYEDIEANYAVLMLAREKGFLLENYEKAVQDYMENMMTVDFGGNRSYYKDFLKTVSVTDHYIRFTAAVDLIYQDLYNAYLAEGVIEDDETKVKQYILQNFVFVTSISLINKSDEEIETNEKRARKFREEVVNGADINEYVSYTLDMNPNHCFGPGEMDEIFEKEAFALENVGDVSEVFLGTADYNGVDRSAWYFLQRLELTADYVNENYSTLFDQYVSARVNEYIEEERERLVFVPNDYCRSLDLLAVEPIGEVKDNTWVFVLLGIGVGVVVVGGVVALCFLLNPKPKAVRERNKAERAKRRY